MDKPKLDRYTDDDKPEEPQVRFGEHWIPAHQAWGKIETALAVTEAIERFNENFPHLSSNLTRSVVPTVRERLKDLTMRMPEKEEPTDYAAIARELLLKASPEDVMDHMLDEHKMEMNTRELIALVGEKAYLHCLKKEADDYQMNQISPDQTAQIWNEMSRPAPGGGLWSRVKVEKLISGECSKHYD